MDGEQKLLFKVENSGPNRNLKTATGNGVII
jgi:hypothetical protein